MTPAEALDVVVGDVYALPRNATRTEAVAVLRALVQQYEQEAGPTCAICAALYVRGGDPDPAQAVTVSGGTAVCEHHLGDVRDPNVANALLLDAHRRGA